VGSPCDSPDGSPCQVPSPERRPPYRGPSKFVNRAAYPLLPPGMPTFRPIRSGSDGRRSASFAGREVDNAGPPLSIPRDHRYDTNLHAVAVNRAPNREVRAFGATSPPALQTETPSWALGLRTATEAVGTASWWLSVTSCLPC
jgi:hypothetical protein